MKTKTLGIVIIITGLFFMLYYGVKNITSEKIADHMPMNTMHVTSHPMEWSPVFAGVLLVSGILVLLLDKKTTV